MESHPAFEAVVDELGDKVVDGFGEAVKRTRADLSEYRRAHPAWVSDHGERGLANWLHDRLWSHVVAIFDAVPGVVLHEGGPTREVIVNSRFRLRLKRHHMDGAVSSYPTQTALEFFDEPVVQFTLDGLGEVRLVAGYEWDKDLRRIGRAVLSLREGKDNVIWLEELPEPDEASATPLVTAAGDGPGPREPSIAVVDGHAGAVEEGQQA